jgi:hypothetical protein
LDNTRVTNAGLVQLKGLSKLTWLNLNNTQVTDAGVRELQESLPNCKINFSPSTETLPIGESHE